MLVISSSNPSVVTGICDPNKSPARHHHSYKHGWKMKNISGRKVFNTMRVNLSTNKCCWIWYKGFEITSMQKNQGISENSDRHDSLKVQWGKQLINSVLHKKWSFPLRNSSVNVTKSTVSFGFGHSYWRNPYWKTSFFVQCWFHDTSVTDWWLWGWKESWCTIPALNVVKVIEKSQPEYLLISIEDEEKLLSLLNLICSSKRLSTTVNTRANSIIIPAGKLVQIPCKAEIGVIESMKYYYLRKLIVLIHLWHWKKEQRASSRYQ